MFEYTHCERDNWSCSDFLQNSICPLVPMEELFILYSNSSPSFLNNL